MDAGVFKFDAFVKKNSGVDCWATRSLTSFNLIGVRVREVRIRFGKQGNCSFSVWRVLHLII